MSVTLTGTGGFFTRQGAIVGEYNRVAAQYGSALTAGAQSIWVQFASSDQQAVNGLWDAVEAYRVSGQNYQSVLQADGEAAIVLQVNDDVSVVPYTVQQALTLLIQQMKTNSQSIDRPSTGSSVTAGSSNLGDATLKLSLLDVYGAPLDMVFAETIGFRCVNAVAGYEATLSAVGEAAEDAAGPDWPGGSGANTSLTVKDPAVDGLVTDGGFASWGGTGNNTPLRWDIVDGEAGTTVLRSAAGGVRSGTDAAKLVSDGSQATQLAQDVSLSVNTVYAACVYAKINTVDGTGSLVVSLTDGDGNILQDDAGNNLTTSVGLNGGSGVGTSYGIQTVFFSTPRQLPTTARIQVGFGVAPTSGRQLSIDLVTLVGAAQLYAGGPYAAAFAGADRTALDDTYSAAVTTDAGSNTFARGMDRLYGMRAMGLSFPSDTSPTISDSLVTH